MRTGLLAVLLLCAMSFSGGCASMYRQRVNQQLWERELRLQEDCIYRLRWALEDTQRRLDDANQQLNTANKETDVLRDRSGGPDLSVPPSLLGPGGGSGRGSEAPKLPPAPSGPLVEPGREFNPSGSSPGSSPAGKSGTSVVPPELRGPTVSPASMVESTANPLRLYERLNPDAEVERIILNPGLTGALAGDGKLAEDRLNVVIEQRDPNDARVLAPGDVSIVVVDPALEGREARIARWNFDSDEVAKHIRRNRDGGTLQFELPWPTPPAHSDLRLFVRFTTYDGRRLEANVPIEVQMAKTDSAGNAWKKSASKLTTDDSGNSNEDSDLASADSSKTAAAAKKRSVYESGDAETQSPADDDAPREAKRNRPAWSPYR